MQMKMVTRAVVMINARLVYVHPNKVTLATQQCVSTTILRTKSTHSELSTRQNVAVCTQPYLHMCCEADATVKGNTSSQQVIHVHDNPRQSNS